MKLSSLLSSLLVASTLIASQAQAAVALGGAGVYLARTSAVSTTSASMPRAYAAIGFLGAGAASLVAGTITIFFNPYVGAGLLVLSEDGSLPQSDLEQALAQKYSFVQDQVVISGLASLIKSKAEGQTVVSISEEEVLSLIEGSDLLETQADEVQKMIQDLN